MVPTSLPFWVARKACAQSSITGMPCLSPTALMPMTSQGLPKRWVAMIAFVRLVMRAATASGVTFRVTGSTSAKIGIAP